MDPARRWQVASVVTAAASIGVGAFALQRPTSAEVQPIDLDVVGAAAGEPVDLPTLPLPTDAVIVTPDLLERMPTPPTPTSAASPATAVSVASTTSADEQSPAPAPTASPVSTASVASPDEASPASRASAEPTPQASPGADEPASVVTPASPASVESGED